MAATLTPRLLTMPRQAVRSGDGVISTASASRPFPNSWERRPADFKGAVSGVATG